MQTLVTAVAKIEDKMAAVEQEHKKKEDMATEKITALSTAVLEATKRLDDLEAATKKQAEKAAAN